MSRRNPLPEGIDASLTESGEIGSVPLGGPEFLANGTSTSLSLRERVGQLPQQYLSTIGGRGCHGPDTSHILTSSRSERTRRFESKGSVVPARNSLCGAFSVCAYGSTHPFRAKEG